MLVWLTLIHQRKTYLHQGLWIIPCPLFKVPPITETTKTRIWWNWRYSEQRSVTNICNKQTTLTVGQCHGWFWGREPHREWHAGTRLPRLQGDLWMSLWWLDGVDRVKGECGCQRVGSRVWMAEIMSSVASKSGRPETNEKLTTTSLRIPCSSHTIPGSKHLIRKSVLSCDRQWAFLSSRFSGLASHLKLKWQW